MLRFTFRAAVLLVLVAVVLDSTGRGQQPGTDKIYFRDKKDSKESPPRSFDGELKPSPSGYQIIVAGKVQATVSPADIVRVVPGEMPGIDRNDVNAQDSKEKKGEWEKARVEYIAMKEKAKNPPEKARRFLEFKVATTSAKAAEDATEESAWEGKAAQAVTLLDDFLTAYPTGWEAWPVALASTRLQYARISTKKVDDKDVTARHFDEVARTWAKMAKNPELPVDLKQDAAFYEVDALIRGKRFSEANQRIGEALKTAAPGAPKDRLTIAQIAAKFGESQPLDAVKPIEDEIAKTRDPLTRAVGYNLLGELYLTAGKPRDAMWQFLWVEVVYHQDREELGKALVRLADAFLAQGDEDRYRTYRDKARRFRVGP